jgi:hypothetical protein
MTFTTATVIEIVIAAALIVGLIFEPALAEAEERLFRRMRRRVCRRGGAKITEIHRRSA